MSIDISTRLAPKSRGVRVLLQSLLGKMDFRCILLPNEPWAVAGEEGETTESMDEASEDTQQRRQRQAVLKASKEQALAAAKSAGLDSDELKLWGLTLGMTM